MSSGLLRKLARALVILVNKLGRVWCFLSFSAHNKSPNILYKFIDVVEGQKTALISTKIEFNLSLIE